MNMGMHSHAGAWERKNAFCSDRNRYRDRDRMKRLLFDPDFDNIECHAGLVSASSYISEFRPAPE